MPGTFQGALKGPPITTARTALKTAVNMNQNLMDVDIVRSELACLSSGRAGLHVLHKRDTLPELLQRSHLNVINNWLARELKGIDFAVTASCGRYTIKCPATPAMQLRFSARFCRWLLLVRRERYWWPHLPARKRCISLVDWLGQVRQIATKRCPLPDILPSTILGKQSSRH